MSFFICHYVIMSSKNICPTLSLCYSVLQKSPVSLRPSVLLSSKKHLSLFVPLFFCLQDHPFCLSCPHVTLSSKNICPTLSLCYSVLQKSPVSLRPSVLLSSKKHLSLSVPLLFCLQDHPFCLSCPHVTLSSKLPCLPLSLGHYVGHQRIQNLDKTVQKKQKREGVSKCTHPLFYAQSPDFLKPGLCYFLKFLYL